MMKKLFYSVCLIALAFPLRAQFKESPYDGLNDSDVVSAMKEHVGFLASAALEGRKSGSEGEKEAAVYITEVLEDYGLDILSGAEGELFGLKQDAGDTLTSRNVIAFIPGYDKELKDRYIVIGARLDNLGTGSLTVDGELRERIYYGANGNASGLAMLMQLAKKLSADRYMLRRTVIIAAFGSSQELGAGAWYFLNRSFKDADKIDAMINLDMLGTGSNGFYAYTSSNQDLNNLLKEQSWEFQPVKPEVVSREPVNSCHRQFYEKEIPSVFFTTGMYPEYNTERDTPSILQYEDMERELEYIYNFSIALAGCKAPEFRPQQTPQSIALPKDVYAFNDCDYKPTFLGSNDPGNFMQKWVYVYLRYPDKAVKEGIQGRVLVDFIIDEKGKVKNVQVRKGVNPLLDEEAVRVISASPDWKPGRVHGQKVKTQLTVYVEFRLERRK